MALFKKKWTPEEADAWTKEDYITFILSPLIYLCIAVGLVLALLLISYGWIILGIGIILLIIMIKIIDPKLKAISEDYEVKQKKYLDDLEKISRWEE